MSPGTHAPMMRMPSTMNGGHKFSQVPKATIPRSVFDQSCTHKTTFDAGYLIPFYVNEALPGDTFNVRASVFCRLSTPLKPSMDNLFFDMHWFAVPFRLVWNNWQKFNGEQTNPGDSTSFTVPQMSGYACASKSLSDYLGIPLGYGANVLHMSLYHRAYNLIYNQWYRDENLVNAATVDMGDGPDSIANYVLRRRGKRHDYFTSCLPWPQKGAAVSLPLGTSAPVQPINSTSQSQFKGAVSGHVSDNMLIGSGGGNPGTFNLHSGAGAWTASESLYWVSGNTGLIADLSSATAATINALRQAFQIQKLLERDARGGTRYTEIILAHFGVSSPDARLQRPEYLGGSSTPVVISPVAQTAPQQGAGVTTPQANLAAVGTLSHSGSGFTKSFTEHTMIFGIGSVRADLTYSQGLNRMFSRLTRYDFYWPALSHIGEQAVLNKEIQYDRTVSDVWNESVFGYQERYAEYRYKPSLVTGLFRPDAAGTLDVWHYSEQFAQNSPVLGQTFIEVNPPIGRTVAVSSEPQFIGDFYFEGKAARPMPVYSVPGLIDHF